MGHSKFAAVGSYSPKLSVLNCYYLYQSSSIIDGYRAITDAVEHVALLPGSERASALQEESINVADGSWQWQESM